MAKLWVGVDIGKAHHPACKLRLVIGPTTLEQVYDSAVSAAEVVTVQIARGSDAGGVPCRLNEEQRQGQACIVCARSEGLDFSGVHVGFVAGQSVRIHRYCLAPWQDGSIRVR